MTQAKPGSLRDWYFCVNESGFRQSIGLIGAAVRSAQANTSLRPICLYAGNAKGHIRALDALGVKVIQHRPSFEDALKVGYGDELEKFVGHWLRVDLPLVHKADDLILYTDIDVIFLKDPIVDFKPTVFSATPETRRVFSGGFNSGVMIINMAQFRALHEPFVKAIRHRVTGDFSYPAHDQASFNTFFHRGLRNRLRGRGFQWMANENNWKPYWGVNPDAAIIHFHGPKPNAMRSVRNVGDSPVRAKLSKLYNMNPQAFDEYAEMWWRFEREGRDVFAEAGL